MDGEVRVKGEARLHTLWGKEEPQRTLLPLDPGDGLGRGPPEQHAVQLLVEGENGVFAAGQVQSGEGQRAAGQGQGDRFLPSRGQVKVVLEVVQEQEAPVPLDPGAVPQGVPVSGGVGLLLGQDSFCRAQLLGEGLAEQVKQPQPVIGGPQLTELPDGGLKVIAAFGSLALVEVGGPFTGGCGAAPVHVIAQ